MWFLPSLNRRERLAFCLNAIRTIGCSTPGIVVLGADQINDIAGLPLPDGWKAVCQNPKDKSLVAVMNRFVEENPNLSWYGFLQDDLQVQTVGWDTKLIQAAGSTGMASCNDLFKAPTRMTSATVYGGDLIRAFGFWCPTELEHNFQDDFWEEVGRKCGNWTVLMEVVAEHQHAFIGKAANDATYQHGFEPIERDKAAWDRYQASPAYGELLARVMALVGGAAKAATAS